MARSRRTSKRPKPMSPKAGVKPGKKYGCGGKLNNK